MMYGKICVWTRSKFRSLLPLLAPPLIRRPPSDAWTQDNSSKTRVVFYGKHFRIAYVYFKAPTEE